MPHAPYIDIDGVVWGDGETKSLLYLALGFFRSRHDRR
jgi:hypothetical protein